MQQHARPVVAKKYEDQDDNSADVETLRPALDNGAVSRVVERIVGRGSQVTPGDHQRRGHGPQTSNTER